MPDNQSFLVSAFEATRGDALLDSPVDALAGVSAADAEALGKSLGIRTIRDLAEHPAVHNAQALVATNAGMAADRAGAADFVRALESSVGALLATKLDGPFTAVNLPSGFRPGITFGTSATYNVDTLRALDTTLVRRDGGLILDGGGFSQLYAAIVQQTTFGYSKAALATIDRESAQAEAQIGAVIATWTESGGTFSDPLPLGGKLQDIMNQVVATFGSIAGIPSSLNALRIALSSYEVVAAQSFALGARFAEANATLANLRRNVARPSVANGGLPIGGGEAYVGWDGLPTSQTLIDGLDSPNNKAVVGFSASEFDATRTTLRVDGSGSSARIPIGSIFSFQIGGGAEFGLDRYVSASSSVSVALTYEGITVLAAEPRRATIDGAKGWYDINLLREVVANTGADRTGYRLPVDGEFPIAETFGEGKRFSRLKTYVISREPTMEITLTRARAEIIERDFQQNAGLRFTLLGLFTVGVSDSYRVRSVQRSSSGESITITMGPPAISNPVPLSQRVAHVLGGVASYPPNAV